MNNKTCLVVCSMLMAFLFAIKAVHGQDFDPVACTGINYNTGRAELYIDNTGRAELYIDQSCLMRLYNAKLKEVTVTAPDFSEDKPKTKLCHVMKLITYNTPATITSTQSISGWVIEPAECVIDNKTSINLTTPLNSKTSELKPNLPESKFNWFTKKIYYPGG